MRKIDAHCHIGSIGGWANVEMKTDDLIELMDEHQIDKAVICCNDNDATLKAMKQYPDRIVGALYVNPLDKESVQAMDGYVKQGFKAIKLNPLRHAYVADDEIVDAVMDKARKYHLPVCIHSGHPPYSLPWSIALLAERYPDVNVMMIHMGHGHGVYIDAALKMARRYSNLYLEMSGMPMHTKIREAYESVGRERIMFGTDGPFHHPSVEIQKVKMSGVDEEGQQRIFYKNAMAFFQL